MDIGLVTGIIFQPPAFVKRKPSDVYEILFTGLKITTATKDYLLTAPYIAELSGDIASIVDKYHQRVEFDYVASGFSTVDIKAILLAAILVTVPDNAVSTAKIIDDAVTFAKVQNIGANRLLGRSSLGSGTVEQLQIGTGLDLSGGVLSAAGGGGSPGGSNQQIQYNDAGAFAGSSKFVFDNGNNHVKIIPSGSALHSALTNFVNTYALNVFTTTGGGPTVTMVSSTPTARGVMLFNRAGGTLAAPSSVANGYWLGDFLWSGYTATGYVAAAQFGAFVDGVTSNGVVPMRIEFITGTTGANRTARLRILSNGDVVIKNGAGGANESRFTWSTGWLGINVAVPLSTLHVGGGAKIDTILEIGQIDTSLTSTDVLVHNAGVVEQRTLADLMSGAGIVGFTSLTRPAAFTTSSATEVTVSAFNLTIPGAGIYQVNFWGSWFTVGSVVKLRFGTTATYDYVHGSHSSMNFDPEGGNASEKTNMPFETIDWTSGAGDTSPYWVASFIIKTTSAGNITTRMTSDGTNNLTLKAGATFKIQQLA